MAIRSWWRARPTESKGVDAAERKTERGEQAARAMLSIVTSELSCRLTGEKTHRREVGYCFTPDGTNIAQPLIEQGAGGAPRAIALRQRTGLRDER